MKVAVVGLGSAGARHARNLLELGHEVVGFDPAASAGLDQIERAPTVGEAMERVDAVIIASPTSLHGAHALSAIEMHRHVLIEKPVAATAAEAERVMTAADRAGVVCGVAMNLRFHPGVLELKRLLHDGVLGTVRFVQASFGYDLRLWRPGTDYRQSYSARADLGGGIVLDAIHELDYLLWLIGPVTSVSAEMAKVSDLEIDVEDVAVAALRFAGGALGSVDVNFFEPAYRRGCLIVGSHAVARWDWRQATVTISREADDDEVIDVRCDLADTYRAEVVDFLAAVQEGRSPRAAIGDGVAAVRLAEEVKRSARR